MQIFRHKPSQPEIIRSVSYPHRQHSVAQAASPALFQLPHPALFLVLAIIGLVALAAISPLGRSNGQEHAKAQQVQGAQTIQPETVKKLDFTAMDGQINSLIQANPSMDVGVSVVDISTADTANYGVQAPFEAASTAKLLTAIAFLHSVEEGRNNLDSQVGNRSAKAALEALLVDSDNQAWYDFNNVLLSHQTLQAYAQQVGFTDYDADKNTVTPASLARLLSNLYQKKLLNDEHTSLVLSYMQRAKEVEYITSIVPSGAKAYHKPGYLADRVHDALIIDNGNRPYVLVIFTKSRTGTYDASAGEKLFRGVATSSFKLFLFE